MVGATPHKVAKILLCDTYFLSSRLDEKKIGRQNNCCTTLKKMVAYNGNLLITNLRVHPPLIRILFQYIERKYTPVQYFHPVYGH